ncbi:MAG TPA: hypothetical protein VK174_07650 [Chitinophagales bacterium]|nr:hypothetical protein [Chitinophagales bacterium]
MKRILFLFFLSASQLCAQPLSTNPCCTQSEEGFLPCRDTIDILRRHEFYDIGVILPSWLPIMSKDYIAILEGRVGSNLVNGTHGPHVSHEDLPFYHYSHDVDFDVIPDKTDDNRFTNYLPLLVYHKGEKNDTSLHNIVRCEWECGLGMCNKVNPLRYDNDAGRSGGFYTAGHELKDKIWNWPSVGDWVHVEGHYVWDRGHPPSEAEIHPPRFVAIKRSLAEQVVIGDSSVKFATRVDIFASGDGGALQNNRFNAPTYVQRVNMSSKDYEFTVKIDLPRPSPNAQLKYKLDRRKGDSFSQYELIEPNSDSATARVLIPWKTKNANDLEIYARTLYFYWDEGRGVAAELPVDIYKIKLSSLKFKYINDKLSKAEVRLFVNVGSDWVFLNDFHGKKGHILTKGLGKTYKHHWNLHNEFTVYVPRGKQFRVYISGWEVDGIDLLAGDILDPASACDKKTKRFFKNRIFSIQNMLLKGCLDDVYGEISNLHSFDKLGRIDYFTNSPHEGKNDDPCPFSKFDLKDRYFITYTIEKLN